jgi:outer membrane protein assembly factor BamE (lipoprotein component of BamABCDE complex)
MPRPQHGTILVLTHVSRQVKELFVSKLNRLMLCLVLVALVGLNGCLIGTNTKVERQGTYVAPETLSKIEPGKTPQKWVVATLGEPNEKNEIGESHELWKYSYSETRNTEGYVFLIFGGSDKKVTGGKVFIELEKGVVTRYWRG